MIIIFDNANNGNDDNNNIIYDKFHNLFPS